jgi:hypothetical protein
MLPFSGVCTLGNKMSYGYRRSRADPPLLGPDGLPLPKRRSSATKAAVAAAAPGMYRSIVPDLYLRPIVAPPAPTPAAAATARPTPLKSAQDALAELRGKRELTPRDYVIKVAELEDVPERIAGHLMGQVRILINPQDHRNLVSEILKIPSARSRFLSIWALFGNEALKRDGTLTTHDPLALKDGLDVLVFVHLTNQSATASSLLDDDAVADAFIKACTAVLVYGDNFRKESFKGGQNEYDWLIEWFIGKPRYEWFDLEFLRTVREIRTRHPNIPKIKVPALSEWCISRIREAGETQRGCTLFDLEILWLLEACEYHHDHTRMELWDAMVPGEARFYVLAEDRHELHKVLRALFYKLESRSFRRPRVELLTMLKQWAPFNVEDTKDFADTLVAIFQPKHGEIVELMDLHDSISDKDPFKHMCAFVVLNMLMIAPVTE